MPPLGISALPRKVRKVISLEYHYWEKGDAKEARKVRDALVDAIDKEEVVLNYKDLILKGQVKGKFVLQYHWWRGPIIIRHGPSVYHWDVRIDTGEPELIHFVLEENPLEADDISATLKPCKDKNTMTVEYLPPPKDAPYSEWKEQSIPFNTPLNSTKATPAFIEIIDKGDCLVLIDKPLFKKFQFKGKKLEGLWIVERKTPEEAFWEFKRSELPVTRK